MITHKGKNGTGTLIRRGNVYYAAWMFNGKKYRVSTGETTDREARKRLAEIGAGAAERPAEIAEAVEVAEIPAEATDAAETRLDALAGLLSKMDADELKTAARMLADELKRRGA